MVSAVADVLIEASPAETRAAFIDGEGRLLRFFREPHHRPSLVDGIYMGRVTALDKASGGAFVDIGVPAAGYLPRAKGLTEGQTLMVQVLRDGWGEKGPVLTRAPALRGRYLAFQPGGKGVESERGVPKNRMVQDIRDGLSKAAEGRITIRRPALDLPLERLRNEVALLSDEWSDVESKAKAQERLGCLCPPPGLARRLLRDTCLQEEVYIDDRSLFTALKAEIGARMPDLKARIVHHDKSPGLFEAAEVEAAWLEALERRVPISGGGRLTIDETEALVAVDIDSGNVRGGADGIRRANLAAMTECARQIVLRNISGLIVIDPITMSNRGHRKQIVEALRREMKGDDRATDVLGMSAAGLIEMTRQRQGPSLTADALAAPAESIALAAECEAAALLRRALRLQGVGRPVAVARCNIADALQGPLADALAETERRLGQSLELRRDDAKTVPEVFLER